MRSIGVVLFLALFLGSCASLTESVRNQTCNEDGGFEKGMNDARDGKPMNSSFALICEKTGADAARRGYRAGFAAGLESLKSDPFAYTCTYESMNLKYTERRNSFEDATQKIMSRCLQENSSPFCDPKRVRCTKNP